jgi:hypothetical protein
VLLVLGRGLVILALCLAVGLDRVALQSVAWTTMLVTNAQHSSSLVQVVARTFDGQHPCDLCKRISSAQHSQKKQPTQPSPAKPDLICTARSIRIISFFEEFHYPKTAVQFSERGNSPPVPPPRAVLA